MALGKLVLELPEAPRCVREFSQVATQLAVEEVHVVISIYRASCLFGNFGVEVYFYLFFRGSQS